MSDANSEECVPPPAKKTRANNAPPAKATVVQYGRWPKPPSSTLPAQVQPSMQAPVPATQVTAPAQEINVGPSTLQQTLPGPSRQAVGQTLAPSHAISELSAPHQVSVHSPSSPEPSMQDRRVGSFKQVIDQPMAPYHVMVKPPAFCQVVDQFEDVSNFFQSNKLFFSC